MLIVVMATLSSNQSNVNKVTPGKTRRVILSVSIGALRPMIYQGFMDYFDAFVLVRVKMTTLTTLRSPELNKYCLFLAVT